MSRISRFISFGRWLDEKVVARVARWAAFVGAVAVVMTWVASHTAPIYQHGWGVIVFAGVGIACVVVLVVSGALVAWRYFNPIPEKPDEHLLPDAPTSTEPAQGYMTAYEVIHYLADDSEWGNETRQYVGADGMRKSALLDAPAEFKRVAEQGTIRAVGRLSNVGQHTPITCTYWISATLHPFSLYNREISETIPSVPNPDGIPVYHSVRLIRADVVRLWPRCTTIATRIPLLDILHEAEAFGWPLQKRDVSQRFTQGLRQVGAEGVIEIWGLDLKNGWDLKSAPSIYTSERIAPTYFKDHWIEVQQALTHQLNAYTRTSRPAGTEPCFFADLYLDRRQALEWLRGRGIILRDTLKE
jgi:hypothetical protein